MQVDPMSSSDGVAEGNPAHIFAAALVDELARAGLEHVCICPGSRSTALAIVAAKHPALRCWSQIDERSAAFFALGIAKATRRPVALICTSGTAAANFYPAVIEANYAHVPLVVLTADRPPELREWGAGQTIDQIHLYGNHVRWFAEAAVPEANPQMLRYARELGSRAASCPLAETEVGTGGRIRGVAADAPRPSHAGQRPRGELKEKGVPSSIHNS